MWIKHTSIVPGQFNILFFQLLQIATWIDEKTHLIITSTGINENGQSYLFFEHNVAYM